MRKLFLLSAAIGLISLGSAAQAAPLSGADAIRAATEDMSMIEKAQVFVYAGRSYCFYFDGWHGPGWYRCGFAWRRGLGWGGGYGWHGWRHHGYERRYGHRGPSFRGETYSRRDGDRYDRRELRGDRRELRGDRREGMRQGRDMRDNFGAREGRSDRGDRRMGDTMRSRPGGDQPTTTTGSGAPRGGDTGRRGGGDAGASGGTSVGAGGGGGGERRQQQ